MDSFFFYDRASEYGLRCPFIGLSSNVVGLLLWYVSEPNLSIKRQINRKSNVYRAL